MNSWISSPQDSRISLRFVLLCGTLWQRHDNKGKTRKTRKSPRGDSPLVYLFLCLLSMPWRVEERESVVVVGINTNETNSVNDSFLNDAEATLTLLETREPTPVIFTGTGRSFSAGLDMPHVFQSELKFREFFPRLTMMFYRLFKLPLPTVAAINGSAVGAGCVFSLLCDFRVAAEGDHLIGLNQIRLGQPMPSVVLEMLRNALPNTIEWTSILLGVLYSPIEALENKFVHQVVPADRLMATCEALLAPLPRPLIPAYARMKRILQSPVVERVGRRIPESVDEEQVRLGVLFVQQIKKMAGNRKKLSGSSSGNSVATMMTE
eukprot:TRINITY_DN19381_c0_g2_i1.p1 TRINITY_DN19381_c0_g2~~TRINITY_DN19381_c0_g2_i1.p1  ORF type:complete len:321 (-),score=37.07 TRINITY_DN19381_c0_g2_i1:760-1722(-)